MTTQAETETVQPPGKECGQPPEGRDRSSLQPPEGVWSCQHFDLGSLKLIGTPGLLNVEEYISIL